MNILEEAEKLINGERAADYGDASENFGRIADLWTAYHGAGFTRHDVAMMMTLVKVARMSGGYHRDSVVDIAGYAALDERVSDRGSPDDVHKQLGRVWYKLADVPQYKQDGTAFHVYDKEGYYWIHEPEDSLDNYDMHGPFYEFDPTVAK